jgi:hypothetical protein
LVQTKGLIEQPLGKSGQMPAFSFKSKVVVPKTEVLEQPQIFCSFCDFFEKATRKNIKLLKTADSGWT